MAAASTATATRTARLPTLAVLAQSLQGALVSVTLTSGGSVRGTLERCNEQLQLVLVNAEETSAAGEASMRERVELGGERVVGIEFAHAIDVHRLVRLKEKQAMQQRTNRSKRSAPTDAARPEPSVLVVEGINTNRAQQQTDDGDGNDDDTR